jgi:hypothetical protein
VEEHFEHYGVVVGRERRDGMGFGCSTTLRQCYIEYTGVGVRWEVGRLIWIVNSDGIVKTVRQESATVTVNGGVVPGFVFTVEIASEEYCVVE